MLAILASYTRPTKNLIVGEHLKSLIQPTLLDTITHCIDQAHTKIELSSSLPGCEHNAEAVMQVRAQTDKFINEKIGSKSKVNERALLKVLCRSIASLRAGNCYEFSFYTQSLLEKKGVDTKIIRVKQQGTLNSHVLLVTHLDTSTVGNLTSWNSDAILIDPFMKKTFCAAELPNYLEVCIFDDISGKVRYEAFNSLTDTLDADVTRELVEDWQRVIEGKKALSLNHELPTSSVNFVK
jgi:hypothetical protein